MINFNTEKTHVNADNKVVLNEALTYMLTDTEILKVRSIIEGMIANRGNDVCTPTQVVAPAQTELTQVAPKTYEDVTEDTQCKFIAVPKTPKAKTCVCVKAVTLEDGYIGEASVRKVLNSRIREAGGVWNKDVKAYEFKSAKAASDFIANTSALVTADEHNERRHKAAERKARKAQRA